MDLTKHFCLATALPPSLHLLTLFIQHFKHSMLKSLTAATTSTMDSAHFIYLTAGCYKADCAPLSHRVHHMC